VKYSHLRSEENLLPPGGISPCLLILRKMICPYSLEITNVVEEARSIFFVLVVIAQGTDLTVQISIAIGSNPMYGVHIDVDARLQV
jgi:hypothetical protein